jgi:hypothetical protein
MPNVKLTEIVVIMDRSGSMHNIQGAMEEGFAHFMAEQRKIPDPCNVTFYRFNSNVDRVFEERPLQQVEAMLLEPTGGTALLDAMGTAIVAVGARLAAKPEDQRPGKVVVVVITDGQENASTEYTAARVAELVKQQSETYNWQFAFLGANIDSFAVAAALNIERASTQDYAASGSGVMGMSGNLARGVSNYRSSGKSSDKLIITPDDPLPNKTP